MSLADQNGVTDDLASYCGLIFMSAVLVLTTDNFDNDVQADALFGLLGIGVR